MQLSQQQQAATDAVQALAARAEELQQIKASSTTEVQAWQAKSDELKEVSHCALWAGVPLSREPGSLLVEHLAPVQAWRGVH